MYTIAVFSSGMQFAVSRLLISLCDSNFRYMAFKLFTLALSLCPIHPDAAEKYFKVILAKFVVGKNPKHFIFPLDANEVA